MGLRSLLFAALLGAACGGPPERARSVAVFEPIVGKVDQGRELIGTPAPSLDGVQWVDGGGHPLEEERGKVVLVRWWTDTCPLCRNSAPAVKALQSKYGERLAVRAVYHNKVPDRPVTRDNVRAEGERLGFPPLIGHDRGWSALKRWWTGGARRRYTSVTFLVGKQGRIRLIHTGGEFHTPEQAGNDACLYDPECCADEFAAIDRAIAALSAES